MSDRLDEELDSASSIASCHSQTHHPVQQPGQFALAELSELCELDELYELDSLELDGSGGTSDEEYRLLLRLEMLSLDDSELTELELSLETLLELSELDSLELELLGTSLLDELGGLELDDELLGLTLLDGLLDGLELELLSDEELGVGRHSQQVNASWYA